MKLLENVDFSQDGLTRTLGIEYRSTDDPETLEARLVCTPAISQAWGYMSGGATLALAENLAGVASVCLSPGSKVLGINVSANHISPAKTGETVIATARLLRQGYTLHNWLVEVRNEEGAIISEVQVTNYAMKD